MPEVRRNILWRKVRASLAILGIVIGVLALIVMGGVIELPDGRVQSRCIGS